MKPIRVLTFSYQSVTVTLMIICKIKYTSFCATNMYGTSDGRAPVTLNPGILYTDLLVSLSSRLNSSTD